MTYQSSNDDDGRHGNQREPDAHGQTALLLVESLIHGLVARSLLSVAAGVEIVEIAADVKAEYGIEMGDSPTTRDKSLVLLESIRASLGIDVGREGERPGPRLVT